MSYQSFAALYDQLMADAPYDQWVQYIQQQLSVEQIEGVSLLDVGCGTGELLVRMHQLGANVTGVDLSSEMLSIARSKCELAGFSPMLFEQSMTDIHETDAYDVVTIFCDSLNYLQSEEEVKQTFKQVYRSLKQEGILLFDVHSIYKIEHGFIGQTFADADEAISYIWTSFEGEYPASVEHELSFFVRDQYDKYERFDEVHKQRTFSIEQYEQWLKDAGFVIKNVHADFSDQRPHENSERIFFTVQK